jgi:hypothetical protein
VVLRGRSPSIAEDQRRQRSLATVIAIQNREALRNIRRNRKMQLAPGFCEQCEYCEQVAALGLAGREKSVETAIIPRRWFLLDFGMRVAALSSLHSGSISLL